MILEVTQFCIENLVVHYKGKWYLSLKGIPTGGPESGSIANIFTKWILDEKLLNSPSVSPICYMVSRSRFLDDIFAPWKGTTRQFLVFLGILNDEGRPYGIQFKGDCGKKVNFLDVVVDITNNCLTTSLYIKPTDSPTYVHRRSYHSTHVFKSLPSTQFRRASLICSNLTSRKKAIDHMFTKFLKSGYKEENLITAKETALALDRNILLYGHSTNVTVNQDTTNVLTFVIYHSPYSKPLRDSLFTNGY